MTREIDPAFLWGPEPKAILPTEPYPFRKTSAASIPILEEVLR
jgi:hypothetical protein